MTSTRFRLIDFLVIFFTSLFLFTVFLNHQEIIGFESRFYLFALEMWRHGLTAFPMAYQHPYPDYPVSSTVLIYFAAKLFSGLSKLTAVLPGAIAAAMTVVMTYLIGSLQNRRWGLYAAVLLLFTVAFIREARTISLDQYITLITTLCFYVAYSASVLHKTRRLWFFIPLLILGFAFRGPIGLIIPASVLFIFYLSDKNFKSVFIISSVALITLCVSSLIFLLVAHHVGGMQFVNDILRMQVFSRIPDSAHIPPFYFYFTDSLGSYAVVYPLAILVLLGYKKIALSDRNLILKCLGWSLIILIGMSIPGDKKARYILAMAPALALIAAYLFVAPAQQKYFHWLRNSFLGICFIFPAMGLILLSIAQYKYPDIHFAFKITLGLMLAAQLFVIIFRKKILIVSLAMLSLISSYIFIIEPINLHLNATTEFVKTVETSRLQQHAQLIFYQQNRDGWPIKYLVNSNEEKPIFVNQLTELASYPHAFVLANAENKQILEAADFTILYRGKIGHDGVVVFSAKPSSRGLSAGPRKP